MYSRQWFTANRTVASRRRSDMPDRRLSCERLEDRTVPTVTISGLDTLLGQVAFTGDGSADSLVLTRNIVTGHLEHNVADGVFIETADDLDPTPGVIQTMTVGSGTARNITVNLGGDNDQLALGNDWTFDHLITYNGGGATENNTLAGTDGGLAWSISALASYTGGITAGTDGLTFSNVQTLTAGSGSADSLTGDAGTRTWTLDATQTFSDGVNTMTFSGMETLQGASGADRFDLNVSLSFDLYGGAGADSFWFNGVPTLTGSIDGEGGSDTLNYTGYLSSTLVVLTGSGPTGFAGMELISMTGSFDGIDTLLGSVANPDYLQGEDVASTWVINPYGTSSYDDGTASLIFADFDIFQGGTQNDDFTVVPSTVIPYQIDGGDPVLPTLPGDSITIDNTAPPLPVAPTGQTFTYTGPGSGIYSSNEYADVTFTSIETFSSTSPIPNLVINATAANRDFRVVRNGGTVEVRDITVNPYPGVPYFVYGYASFDTLTINGRDSDSNRVILDFGSGGAATNPIQPLGFTFNGDALITGSPVGGTDRLDVAGGGTVAAFDAIATTFTDADSGTGSFTDSAAVSLGSIQFNDLEEYDLSGGTLDPAYAFSTTIQDLTFDFSALAGPTTATFEDSGTAADGVSRVETSAGPVQFVPTAFSNPDTRLIVDTTAATADTVLLGDMDNGFSPATLTFTGDSTADVYQLTSAGFLNAAPGVILATATFDLNGVSDTLRWLHDLNDGTSQLALSGGATLTTGNAAIRTYNGVITGTGNLVKQGAGSWTLGGTVSNTYTGSTTVNAGTLYLGKGGGAVAVGGNLVVGDGVGADDADKVQFTTGSGQVISSALVTVHTTGRLDLAGFSNTLAGLTLQSGSTFAATVESGAGTLTLGTGANVTLLATGSGLTPADVNGNLALAAGGHTFTVADGTGALDGTGAAADTDLLVNAVVSGTGALTKTGPGRLQLNGANTYAGTTTVNQGVLHLTGSLTGAGGGVVLAGPTTVLSGGTSGVLHGAGRGVTVAATATNATIRDLLRVRNTTAGSTGVLVQAGGSVRLVNNTGPATTDGISGHAVNVDVSGASAFLQGNKINGTGTSGSVGLRLQGGAVVDAGQVGGGYDFTGLRLTQANPALANGSTGGNVFGEAGAMYTAGTATAGGAIRDLNTNGLNAAAGPQGAPFDAYAQNNSFNGLASVPANYVAIENLIRHDYDSSPLGFVNYVTPPAGGPVLIVDGDGALLFYSVTPTAAKNNSWDQRSMIRRVRMSFSDFVFIEMSALSLTRGAGFEATGGAVSPTTTVSRVGPVVFDPTGAGTGRYFNYDFGFGGGNVEASGSLVDGKYTLALDETKIQASVSSAVFSDPSLQIDPVADQAFHRLFGDHNGDQLVTSIDQAIFTPSYRSIRSQAKYVEYFDFDNDGDIDLADQTQFNRRLNRY